MNQVKTAAKSKSFLRIVLEGLAWSSGGAGLTKIIGIIAAFAVISKFSLHEYGTYQLTLAAWGLLAAFLFQGIDQIVIAEGAKYVNKENNNEALLLGKGYFLFKVAAGFLLWLLAWKGAGALEGWYSRDVLEYLAILSFTFLALPLSLMADYDFSIRRNFFMLNASNLVGEIFKGGGIIFVLFAIDGGITEVLWVTVLAALAKGIVFLPFWASSYISRPDFSSLKRFSELALVLGKWVILRQYLGQFSTNTRVFLIQYFLGREVVALFSVAEKLWKHIISLFPLSAVLIPAISSELDNRFRVRQVLERGIKYSAPFFFAIALAAAVASPFFISLFFPQYTPSLPLFYILLALTPFMGMDGILISFFFSYREQKTYFFISLAKFILMLAMLPLFVKAFGVYGIPLEYVLGAILIIFIRYVTLVKVYPDLKVSFAGLFQIDEYDKKILQKFKNKFVSFSACFGL